MTGLITGSPMFVRAWSLLLLLLGACGASESLLVGPLAFTRGNGAPVAEEVRIIVPADMRSCVLRIDNNPAKPVTSADIAIDGNAVLAPGDFNGPPARIERLVALGASSVISVILRSAPGSSLTLSLVPDDCWLQPVFGPERFVRANGKPITEERRIRAPSGPAIVRLINGDGHGVNAVSSADVRIDGRPLFKPNDFNQQVTAWTVGVQLSSSSELTVQLSSVPESYITICIDSLDCRPLVASLLGCDVRGKEGGTQPEAELSLSRPSMRSLTALFRLQSVTAIVGSDIELPNERIVIPAGTCRIGIPLRIIDDSLPECTETARLDLLSISDGTVSHCRDSVGVCIEDNDPPLPTVQWQQSSTTDNEEAGSIVVQLQLSKPAATPVIVDFDVAGTATRGRDYQLTDQPLTIPAGQTNLAVRMFICIDDVYDPNEKIILTLQGAQGATLGSQKIHTVTIRDNGNLKSDCACGHLPAVRWATAAQAVNEGTGGVIARVVLDRASQWPVTMAWTVAGTADRTKDITGIAQSGFLTIPATSTSAELRFAVVQDSLMEGEETVLLTVSDVAGARPVEPIAHIVRIADDDAVPVVSFSGAMVGIPEQGGATTVRLELSAPASNVVSVGLSTSGTATAGGDFAAIPATVTIPAGMQRVEFSFTAIDDSALEGDESAIVTIIHATGAVVGATGGTFQVTIIDDDAKLSPSLAWNAPAAITYGTALSPIQLSATAAVPGSFAYSPAVGAVLPAGDRSLSVVFTPTDTVRYATAMATVPLTVRKAVPALTWVAPAAIAYGQALGAVQLSATSAVAGTFAYIPPSGEPLGAGTHVLSTVFTPTDVANYTTATATVSLTVQKAVPSISWANPAAITYGQGLGAVQLSATSAVAGTFAYIPVSGAVLNAGMQTLSTVFTPMDGANYTTATATVPLTVQKAVPALTWADPAAIIYGQALGAVQLSATSSVVGTFAYTPALGAMLGAGTQTLSAEFTPTDAANYTAATVMVPLTVQKAVPALTWTTPAAITYGEALGTAQLSATSPVAGTFVYTPASGAVLGAGMQTLSTVFTPTDAANYTTTMATVPLTVEKAVPSLTWAAPATITYGEALGAAQLSATSPVAGTFVYTPPSGAVLGAGSQTLSTVFTPTDAANYTTAMATVPLAVQKAVPSLSWAEPAAITYGEALGAAQLSATSHVIGAFAYAPASGAVLDAGIQTLGAVFTPSDGANYTTATATVPLTVQKAVPMLTWAAPAAITAGQALGAAQLSASAPVAGSFSYVPAAGTILEVGIHALTAEFTPSDMVNFTSASVQVQIEVRPRTENPPSVPAITWAAPAPITYGTALGPVQLSATSPVDGTFAYAPATGSILGAGTHRLSVVFNPADAVSYTTATATVTLTVQKAVPMITWAHPVDIVHGDALGAAQLSATSPLPGAFAYTPAEGAILAAGVQTLSTVFVPTDAANYTTATATVPLTVRKAVPAITWAAPAAIIYGQVLGAAQLSATSAVAGTFAYTPASGAVLGAGTHVLSAVFTPTDGANYTTATATVPLTVEKAVPALSWEAPAAITYGQALDAAQLSATSAVAGTFAYTPASGAVLGAGSHTLNTVFTPTDAANYAAATAMVPLTVEKAVPAIAWATPVAITYGQALGAAQLSATSAVAGTFTYVPAPGAVLGAGSHTLNTVFTPTDVANYTTATAMVPLTVQKAVPALTWMAPATITYGHALSVVQLSATSSVVGSFAYTPASGAVLGAGAHTLSTVFTPTDAANYAAATAMVPLTVEKAVPAITWAAPVAITYGQALGAAQLSATSAVAGAFTYVPAPGAVLGAGSHTLNAVFTPTDAANYTTATATVPLTVQKAVPALTWAAPAAIIYGQALGAPQLSATSAVAGAFAYTPASGTVLGAGTQTLSTVFTPSDAANYATATATVPLTVEKAVPVIAWAAPVAITYGQVLGAVQLSATSSVAGAFAYTPASGTVLSSGAHVLSATFTPTDAANYTAVTATVPLTVEKAVPEIIWAMPLAITYGQALGPAQLSAASLVAGTFAYMPAAGEVLPAGLRQLTAVFTPTESGNYLPTTATVDLQVMRASPAISWNEPAGITYGTALSGTQLNATAAIPGTFAYDPAIGALLDAGQPSLSVTFAPEDASNFLVVVKSVPLAVAKAVPTVAWADPAPIPVLTALGPQQLSPTASVPGAFAFEPPAGTLLPVGVHTLRTVFTPEVAKNYASVATTVQVTVTRLVPTITWAAPAPVAPGTALGPVQLNAQVDRAGTLTYDPPAGTVITSGPRILTVQFSPQDPSQVESGNATVTIQTQSAAPSITWKDPASIVYGTPLGNAQLNAVSSRPGMFAYQPAAGTVLPAGDHALSVVYTPSDPAFGTITAQVAIHVLKATPDIAWTVPQAVTYGATLTAVQLNATASTSGSFSYAPSFGAIPVAGVQTLSVAFTPTDVANFIGANASVPLRVNPAPTAVTWADPAPIIYGAPLTAVQLDATASVPGTFAYTPALGTVLMGGNRPLSVLFTPTDAQNFATSTATVTQVVRPAAPVLVWPAPAALVYGHRLAAAQLNATSAAPGAFTYDPPFGHLLPAGHHTLSAHFQPAEAANYLPGTISVGIDVEKASPVITWAAPAPIPYGQALTTAQLAAVVDVPGTLAYAPAAGTVLDAGSHALHVVHTPTDAANYVSGTTAMVDLAVGQAKAEVTWATPAAIDFGTPLSDLQLNAASSTPGTFTYNPEAGAIVAVGDHVLTATFQPSDAVNYAPVEATVMLRVLPTPVSIAWADPAPIVYGTQLGALQLNATGSVPGQLVYTPAAGTVLSAGLRSLNVTLTPTDVQHQPVQATVRITVAKATPVLSWARPTAATYGTALTGIQLNASSPTAGTFAYTPAAGAVLSGGTHDLQAVFTPTDTANHVSGMLVQTVWTILPATPLITWPRPADIVFGQRLTEVQLNAQCTAEGTFEYRPAATTLLYAGDHALRVVFVPAQPANYATTEAQNAITVLRATPVLTWAEPAAYRYPLPLPADRLGATAGMPGAFTYDRAVGAILEPGSYLVSVVFAPTDTENHTTAAASRTLMVQRGLPIITWADPAPVIYGTALWAQQLNAQGSVPGTLVYTPAEGAVPDIGTQTLSVELLPTDQARWENATATAKLNVLSPIPVITWAAPASIVYGTALGSTQLNATASMPGTFTYDPPVGTVLGAGSRVLTATFHPDPQLRIDPVSAQRTLLVAKAKPLIVWDPPLAIEVPTALSSLQLNAQAQWTVADVLVNVPGAYVYAPPAGTVLPEGSHILHVDFTPTDLTNYIPADGNVLLSAFVDNSGDDMMGDGGGPNQNNPPPAGGGGGEDGGGGGGGGSGGSDGNGGGGGGPGGDPDDDLDGDNDLKGGPPQGTIVFKKRPPIIWEVPRPIPYGTVLSAAQLDAASPVAGSYTYTPPAGTLLEPGAHRIGVQFKPNDTAAYIPVKSVIYVVVEKESPEVVWDPVLPLAHGAAIGPDQLNARSTAAGTFTYSLASGTILDSSRAVTATFTPANGVRYATVILKRSITVAAKSRIIPVLSEQQLLSQRWQDGHILTQDDIEEQVRDPESPGRYIPGRFVSADVGRTLVAGGQIITVEFRPFDQEKYATATLSADLTVFERIPAPLWLGSIANSSRVPPAPVHDLRAEVVVLPTAQTGARLTWTPPSGPGLFALDVMRMTEVEYSQAPVIAQGVGELLRLDLEGGGMYPYAVDGTNRFVARSPQWITLSRLAPHATGFDDATVRCSDFRERSDIVRMSYLYLIRTTDQAGNITYSGLQRVAMPFERPILSGPVHLAVTKAPSLVTDDGYEADRFQLTWEPPADPTGVRSYDIYLASAVESDWPLEDKDHFVDVATVELVRRGYQEMRHRWIKVGTTTGTNFEYIDDRHPDLFWSQLRHFFNAEYYNKTTDAYVDPWTVEHCQPSYLFKVVAVGDARRQLVAEQASNTVVIDGDRRSLMRPRFSNRLNRSKALTGDPQWSYQDIDVSADTTGAVSVSWSRIAYDFSLPEHMVTGPYGPPDLLMDWGKHTAVILCDGQEVGSSAFNSRASKQPPAFVHKPGPGRHTYAVRIENYYHLTCQSRDIAVDVGGATLAVNAAELAPFNLEATGRTAGAWQMSWSPSVPAAAGGTFAVSVDGAAYGTSTTGALAITGQAAGIAHEVRVDLLSSTGVPLASSLVYRVPAMLPEGAAAPLDAPAAPAITAIAIGSVSLRWGDQAPAAGVTGYDLSRDGRIVAHLPLSGTFVDAIAAPAASHVYRLRAVARDDRKSPFSTIRRVNMPVDRVPPTQVVEVTSAVQEDGSVVIGWQAAPVQDGVQSYAVYRNDAYLAAVSATTHRDESASGGSYRYTVIALDAAGNESPISQAVVSVVPARIPAVPGTPEARLVQRLVRAGYPLERDPARAHLDYATEVSWVPAWGEGSPACDVAAYRIYRDGALVAQVPVSILISSTSPGLGYGRLLTRAELLMRANGYFDPKRGCNVYSDTTPLRAGEQHTYAVSAVSRAGEESLKTDPVETGFAERSAPRRPEILRIRDVTSRSLTLDVNAWAFEHADPYDNADYRFDHLPGGGSAWPLPRVDDLVPIPYRTTSIRDQAMRRQWLDDRRYGRLLDSDLFGGGDSNWLSGNYQFLGALTQGKVFDQGGAFAGSGDMGWADGIYADGDIFVSVNGELRQVFPETTTGWDIDDRPCRLQVITLDGLEPGTRYDLRVVFRSMTGRESASLVTPVVTNAPSADGFEFVQAPRFVKQTKIYAGSYSLSARALTTAGSEAGITYSWRHLTENGTFAPSGSSAARDTVFTPSSLWQFSGWKDQPQTIRCYATYLGRTKYLDVVVRPDRPEITFDPATFPIFPGPVPRKP